MVHEAEYVTFNEETGVMELTAEGRTYIEGLIDDESPATIDELAGEMYDWMYDLTEELIEADLYWTKDLSDYGFLCSEEALVRLGCNPENPDSDEPYVLEVWFNNSSAIRPMLADLLARGKKAMSYANA